MTPPTSPAIRTRAGVVALLAAILSAGGLTAHSPATPVAAATQASHFVSVQPCRLLDTRESPGAPIAGGATTSVDVAGRCGIADDAVAAALTVTAVGAQAPGYITVFPRGEQRPTAASVSYRSGGTIANLHLAELGDGGAVSVFSLRRTHVVIDVSGYFVPASGAVDAGRFVPVEPHRVLDTRDTGRPAARTSVRVALDVPAGSIAASVTITSTDTRTNGYFSAHASGTTRPNTSVLNIDRAGQTRASSAIVPLSDGGSFDVYTRSGDHVIVDVTGYFTGPDAAAGTDGLFVATTPTRLVDTRSPVGADGGPRLWDRGTREFDPTSITGGPVGAVAANFTVTATEDRGHIRAFPSRTDDPLVSTVNYDAAGSTIAASSVVSTSTDGIAVTALEATHLTIDVTGWFTGSPASATTGAPTNRPPGDRTVYIISDSTMAGIRWNGALPGLQGFRAVTDLESCRRLVQPSCRGREGYAPRTLVSEIRAIPSVTSEDILVVGTGYDDWYGRFSSDFDVVVAAARAKGFHHIAWATYVTDSVYYTQPGSLSPNYAAMNDILRAKVASGAYPEVRLWDLAGYTENAVGWFYSDGIHETRLGSWGIADWISRHVRAFDDRPCVQPWTPGGIVADPCPAPEITAAASGLPDIAGLYGL